MSRLKQPAKGKKLRKYLDTKKKPSLLHSRIERHLLNHYKSDRVTTVIHPSEITKPLWCPRESWFLLMGYPKEEEDISFRLHSIFAEGHTIHRKWQDWADQIGVLEEAELPVIYAPYMVHGHTDGILNIDGEHLLWEIKSIGLGTLRKYKFPIEGGLAQSFRSISRPFTDHVRQACFYVWALKQGEEYDDIERILFTYECKEDQSAKEFIVRYDEDYLEDVLKKLDILFPLKDYPPECVNEENCACRRYKWEG